MPNFTEVLAAYWNTLDAEYNFKENIHYLYDFFWIMLEECKSERENSVYKIKRNEHFFLRKAISSFINNKLV